MADSGYVETNFWSASGIIDNSRQRTDRNEIPRRKPTRSGLQLLPPKKQLALEEGILEGLALSLVVLNVNGVQVPITRDTLERTYPSVLE